MRSVKKVLVKLVFVLLGIVGVLIIRSMYFDIKNKPVSSLFKSAMKYNNSVDSMCFTVEFDGCFSIYSNSQEQEVRNYNLTCIEETDKRVGAYRKYTKSESSSNDEGSVNVYEDYTVLSDDGSKATYYYRNSDEDDNMWKTNEEVLKDGSYLKFLTNDCETNKFLYSKLTKLEETEMYNGVEVYHVRGDIDSSDFGVLLKQFPSSNPSMGMKNIDKYLSNFSAKVDYYFSVENSCLIGMCFDFIPNESIVKNDGVSIKSCKYVLNVDSVNKYSFEIPDEVLRSVWKG